MSPDPSKWPKGVSQIDVADLEWLGIDYDRALYWDGRPIEIRKTVTLSGAQAAGAVLVAIFAVLGGLGAFATGMKDTVEFACARHWLGDRTCARDSLSARTSAMNSVPNLAPTTDHDARSTCQGIAC